MKVQITYYGMDGEGKNLTEAKKDAGSKIEKALHGYYTPRILRHGDQMALVAREPLSGWGYRLIYADTEGPVYLSMSRGTAEEVIHSAYHHMAQNAGHYNGIESKLSDRERKDLDSYFKWQSDYKEARSKGYDDENARYIAGGQLQLVKTASNPL